MHHWWFPETSVGSDKLEMNLFDRPGLVRTNVRIERYFDTLVWKPAETSPPLACGNGCLLLDSMGGAIHTVVWLKRKLNPFDVINVSITAFAHNISMEMMEKKFDSLKEMFMNDILISIPVWISICLLQLKNYMIFHRSTMAWKANITPWLPVTYFNLHYGKLLI